MLCLNEDWTVMIIGSGAREHAISLAYEKSPKVKKIIVIEAITETTKLKLNFFCRKPFNLSPTKDPMINHMKSWKNKIPKSINELIISTIEGISKKGIKNLFTGKKGGKTPFAVIKSILNTKLFKWFFHLILS